MANKKWRKKRAFQVGRAVETLVSQTASTDGIKLESLQEAKVFVSSTEQHFLDFEKHYKRALLARIFLQIRPPANLEFILYLLMSRADCEALIGDLEEQYRILVERLGKTRTDLWYTKQVFTSIWPLLRDSVRRLTNSTVINGLCLVLRFCGLGSMAEDLKQLSGAKRKQK
jgi:hypothetical protein